MEGLVFWAAIWCGVGRLARGCDKVVVDGGGGTEIIAEGGASGKAGVVVADGDFAGIE